MEETTEKKLLPVFNFSDLEEPKLGEGKKTEFILTGINDKPKGDYDSRQIWLTVDGVEYTAFVNINRFFSLLNSGIQANMLPKKGSVCLYRHTDKQKNCGINFHFEGAKPVGLKKKDGNGVEIIANQIPKLIEHYNLNNNQQPMQQQAQQVFQPHLTASRNFEKENKERQEQIDRGMAYNAGVKLFIAKKAADKDDIDDKAMIAYRALKRFNDKLNTPEEIIKGVDFPVDESDMDEIDEIFGTK